MYSGRPVPAIAELVSNSWDADATEVNVDLPLDQAWDPTNESHTIKVSDNGRGMNWELVRDSYLDVGRDRREEDKTDRSPGGRLLQGRKGIGKLAGFGIADTVEIQTVYEKADPALNEQVLLWFALSWEELKKAGRNQAPVTVIYAGPISKAPAGARTTQGTTVILQHLHNKKAQSSERFQQSMTQRFLVIGSKFRVVVNGEDLKEEAFKLQYRWPEKEWGETDVSGCGPVKYWIGFTEHPRRQNEGELSGILIYTRGKISQEATFFDISGGVYGQHGLRYLVGMVRAEWLDEAGGPDQIATPRDAIAWESPSGHAFQKWGQETVKKYLAEWAHLRSEAREKEVMEIRPSFKSRIEGLSPAYKKVAIDFVHKFKAIEMETKEFEDLLSWFLSALENETLKRIIEKIKDTNDEDLGKLDELLSKMHIRTAVGLLQILKSNLAAINALEKMHREDAKERGVISKHLETFPFLLNPTWILNKPEARVATWIKEEFGLESKGTEGDDDRADFICVGIGGTLHIVEIKRGKYVAKVGDFSQADKYRVYVEKRFKEISDPDGIKYGRIQSHLIAAELSSEANSIKEAYGDKGWVIFTTWDDLIERAKLSHCQYIEIFEKIATEEDNGEE
ncbi:Histidine kinase-, DNA gyrase B-, and HSP90-like ATPase [Candidatus Burarchaeum australiense]|nr:Histidine kinase-, DNA gyrase B-, and HSP90-like ATPase [Candidatus Burarchaeum australiense]